MAYTIPFHSMIIFLRSWALVDDIKVVKVLKPTYVHVTEVMQPLWNSLPVILNIELPFDHATHPNKRESTCQTAERIQVSTTG